MTERNKVGDTLNASESIRTARDYGVIVALSSVVFLVATVGIAIFTAPDHPPYFANDEFVALTLLIVGLAGVLARTGFLIRTLSAELQDARHLSNIAPPHFPRLFFWGRFLGFNSNAD